MILRHDIILWIVILEHNWQERLRSVDVSKTCGVKAFTPGDVSQMLPRLIEKGLIYKNRLGKYCFAVPLFSGFIKRRLSAPTLPQ